MNLENEINDQLQAMQSGNLEVRNRAHSAEVEVEDASSSNESEVVDDTQRHIEDIGTEMLDANNTTPETVLKDVHFLKEAWANLAEFDENEVNMNPTSEHEKNEAENNGVTTSLTKVQNVNQEADSANPSSEDTGFQLVITKAKKKADKAKAARQGNYTTRSKVGHPKPFK